MNPWGLLFIGLGVVLIIIGVKDSQHNIVSAISNRAATGTTTTSSKSAPTTGTGTLL